MKLLLDTNALIDFVAPRKPYDEAIRKLCVASLFGDVQLWVSVQSYADAYYVLRKGAGEREVKGALLSTLEMFLPCNLYASELSAALESDWSDLEDYLLVHSMKHVNADWFITRDKTLLADDSIRSITATGLLEMLEEGQGLRYDEVDI